MPLTVAPLNKELIIMKIIGNEKTKKHLMSLGVIENSNVNVIANNNGNLILVVKNVRLALDKEIASRIYVM